MIVHYCMSFLHVPKMHVPTLKCPNLHVPKPGLPKLQIGPSYVTGVNSKICVFFEIFAFEIGVPENMGHYANDCWH